MAAKKKAAKKKAAAPKKKSTTKARLKNKASAQPVVHWEIQAKNPVKVQKFYAELFAWKISAEDPTNYGMVASKAGSLGIDGGIGASAGTSKVTFYVQVENIPATLAKCERLGGKTIMPRTDLGMVTMAMFQDVEGNQIGLVEA